MTKTHKTGRNPTWARETASPVLENPYDTPGQEDAQKAEVERPERLPGVSPRRKEEKVRDADDENRQSEQREQQAGLDHPHNGHNWKPKQAAESAEKPSESRAGHGRNPFIDASHYRNSQSGRKATRDASRRLALGKACLEPVS